MITPHKYFQHPHHSSKIHGTHYFTSYQQGRSAAPLRSIQPYNPITTDFGGFAWKCPHAPQDAPAKLHIKAQWIMMWCCTLNNGYVRSSDQLPFFFFLNTPTAYKRGTTFLFGGTLPILPRSHRDPADVLHSAGAGNTSCCREHQQAAFHTKSPQHVHSPTGCKDWH